MDNNEKYSEITEKLKNLEHIKASDNFVNKLHSKIVEFESEKRLEHSKKFDEGRGGFLRNLFGNRQYPWLIPAVGFTVIVFFVFYITYLSQNPVENSKESPSTKTQEQTEQKNQALQNQTPTIEPPVTLNKDNSAIEKEKNTSTDIAADLKSDEDKKQSPKVENKIESPVNNDGQITIEQSNITQTEKVNPTESSKPTSKELNKDTEKNESYNEGKSGMQPMTNQSTSARGTDDIPKAIAVTVSGNFKNPLDKLNTIDKSNLENLKNKVSDN